MGLIGTNVSKGDRKMIAKKQADEARALLEQYEKQQKEQGFLPGEILENAFGDITICKTENYGEWRRPVDVPGVLVRWFGGECPVSDKNAEVIVVYRRAIPIDKRTVAKVQYRALSGEYVWEHYDRASDIIAYIIVPEWLK